MTEQLTPMKGDEFVTKLLAGERDFRRIKLEKGHDVSVHERYNALCTFLANSRDDLKENPVNVIQADLSYVTAPSLYLPYTKASGARLLYANFKGSTFDEADFSAANLKYSHLQQAYFRNANLKNVDLFAANLIGSFLTYADLGHANLSCANLYEASLQHANLYAANFERADLSNADLKKVKNLGNATWLSSAHFFKTRIDRKDLAVLKRALKERKPFIYNGFFEEHREFFEDWFGE